MPKSNANLALKGLDEMFSTEESRQEQKREQVQQIPIEELFPFKEHPFKVLDDEAMQRTVESVAQYGVLAPLIARPRPEGGYEIISGHRRQHAAELAGLDTLPVIVREMTDDAAILLMVDSNLQRESILPSERAFAYKMKLDAMSYVIPWSSIPKDLQESLHRYVSEAEGKLCGYCKEELCNSESGRMVVELYLGKQDGHSSRILY
jgi:ParB family chromosome partitioning protein